MWVALLRTWAGLGGRRSALCAGSCGAALLGVGVGWPAGLWLTALVAGSAVGVALVLPGPSRRREAGPIAAAWTRIRGSRAVIAVSLLAALALPLLALGGLLQLPAPPTQALLAAGAAGALVGLWYGRTEPVALALGPPALGGAAALGLVAWVGLPLTTELVTGLALGVALGAQQALELLAGRLARWRAEEAPDHRDEAPLLPGAIAFVVASGVLASGPAPALGQGALIASGACLLAVHALLPLVLGLALRLHGPGANLTWRALSGSLWLVRVLGGGGLRFRWLEAPRLEPSRRCAGARDAFHRMAIRVSADLPLGQRTFHDVERLAGAPPGVLVANHASLLDVAMICALPIRVVILVKEWVWRAPMIGPFVQVAGYLNVDRLEGDALEAAAREALESGAWILVFPEGSRTRRDGQVGRFRNGAFALARALGVSVTPIAHAGSEWASRPGALWASDHDAHLRILPASEPGASADEELPDRAWARRTRDAIQAEVDRLWPLSAAGSVWPRALGALYHYQGPVASHYAPAKVRLDPLVAALPSLVAELGEGEVLMAGCGLGIMTARVALAAPRRPVRAIDLDPRKLAIARAAIGSDRNVTFVEGDLREADLGRPQVAVLADVLHYAPREAQVALVQQIADALAPGGALVLRDGVRDAPGHAVTRTWERFALTIGFTTGERLEFQSAEELRIMLAAAGLTLTAERPDLGRGSDAVFVATKPREGASPSPTGALRAG